MLLITRKKTLLFTATEIRHGSLKSVKVVKAQSILYGTSHWVVILELECLHAGDTMYKILLERNMKSYKVLTPRSVVVSPCCSLINATRRTLQTHKL